MTFANPIPWWAVAAVVGLAVVLAWYAYRHAPLSTARRTSLAAVRAVTLLAIVVLLMRPIARTTEADARGAIVPVLVDMSRSMGLEDAPGRRIDRARQIVTTRLLPQLQDRFRVEVLGFGESLLEIGPDGMHATARRSDLQGALGALRDRYRGKPVAGIVLLSDGGDTSGAAEEAAAGGPAIHAIGVGAARPGRDREVLGVTAAEAVLDDSRIDLAVSAISHGFGVEPIPLRLLENGRPIEVRRVTPAADGVPVHYVFQVSPGRGNATVYSVEIPPSPGELAPENNARSTLVQAPARNRRILLVEGAPGFEHSFLKRAWSADPRLEVDSVVRKGRNEQGVDTFYIQAVRSRSDRLRNGYPQRPEDLFAYDAVVLANVEGHQLTRAQLEATRAFVMRRGGGLLALGARSFVQQGLVDTAIEEVLPLDLHDRSGGVLPAANVPGTYRVSLTAPGEFHPIMQLGTDPAATRQRWEAFPPLASIAPLGPPRPGASVLAATSGPGGAPRALIAVQRYGDGRAMVFAGEAAWRWRMLMPASDRSYDTFWRQAARWLALPAADPIAITVPQGGAPGEDLPLRIVVRNAAYEPIRDADVEVRVTAPDGRLTLLRASVEPESREGGRYVAHFRPGQAGVYRVTADARQRDTALGSAGASVLAGGSDPEMTDPKLNVKVLRRLAAASGGSVIAEDRLDVLADALQAAAPAAHLAVRRDLWHNAWSLLLIVGLLCGEWILRRAWGLR
jgi:uncharacterized membrane protein